MSKISPFLWFDTQAEDAAIFYTSIFPNSKITGIARYPEGGPRPAGMASTVSFTLDGQDFTALNGGPEFKFSEAISLFVSCKDQQEVDYFWEKLTAGGEEVECGWLKDRYGLSWQIVPTVLMELMSDPDPEKAGRAFHAMLRMKKFDIERLKRAAAGEE